MRVVQLVMSRQYRGAEMFAAQLTRELIKLGVETNLIFLFESNSINKFSPTGIPFYDINEHRRFFNVRLLRQLALLLKAKNPHIVQANAGDTLKYAVMAKILYGLKYKIVFRNASTVSSYIKSSLQKLFYSLLYHQVDSIISVSNGSANDFVRTFPSCEKKTTVVPNGIEFIPMISNLFSREVVNLIHIGGFSFEKNHIALIRIFKELLSKIPKTKLWLVGDGPLKGQIEKEVAKSGLSHQIEFVGAKPNVLDYIASADSLLLPSIIEGLPAVILEAFYCRTPVIAFDVGGICEVVKNGKTGWLVTAGDEAAFVTAIEDALRSRFTRDIIENAYNVVVSEYESEKIARLFCKAYEDSLNY